MLKSPAHSTGMLGAHMFEASMTDVKKYWHCTFLSSASFIPSGNSAGLDFKCMQVARMLWCDPFDWRNNPRATCGIISSAFSRPYTIWNLPGDGLIWFFHLLVCLRHLPLLKSMLVQQMACWTLNRSVHTKMACPSVSAIRSKPFVLGTK